MEAVGSRLGRASSRYGTPTVFSGPVRRWKKKWVHVSPSSLSSQHNSLHSHNNSNGNNSNGGGSRLLLCRWTPITPSPSTAAADDNSSDEPPRRKFRYTPIAVLEEQKKVAVRKAENEPTTETGQSTARPTNVTHEMHGKLNMNETSEEETQESNMSQLELGLGFKGDKSQNADDQLKRTCSSGQSMN